MANEEKRRILLTVAPFLLRPPPAIQLAQTLYPTAGAVPIDSTSAIAGAAALAITHHDQSRDRRPHPQQGGCQITVEYLRGLSVPEARWAFHMTGNELLRLVDALELPEVISTRNSYEFSCVEALALTCARLASAGDEFDLSVRYNRSQSSISEIFNEVIIFLDEHWKHLLHFDSSHLLSPTNLERYTNAIYESGAPLQFVWGFIDCTVWPVCRPSHYQRQAYNGHKHYHGLKYQAVMLPNRLFGHLYGPIEGRHNDTFALDESGLAENCLLHAKLPETSGEPRYFRLFGDPAYGLNGQIICPFPKQGRTNDEQKWNTQMSKARIEVEHGFALVTNSWPFLKARWKHHIFQSPVGRYYRVGILLTNALACLHPNQVAQYFRCSPPFLEDYFHK